MTGNTQLTTDEDQIGQMKLCDNREGISLQSAKNADLTNDADKTNTSSGGQEILDMNQNNSVKNEQYWQMQYEALKRDYDQLQRLNQQLEEKLLNLVDTFEKKKEELLATAEFEKSTLMADVDKLSTKLVDARMKLHDREEKDVMHAAECSAPCHSTSVSTRVIPIVQSNQRVGLRQKIDQQQRQQMMDDPNLV